MGLVLGADVVRKRTARTLHAAAVTGISLAPALMNNTERVFGLDLLRAFAILFVVYGHSLHLLPETFPKDLLSLPILDGVTLFFVLSGFLIGRILLRTVAHEDFDGRMLVRFWVRRWFRTLPNYYLVLVVLVAVTGSLSAPVVPLADHLGRYFTFTQNVAWPHPEFFGEAWSLAVEEWFYLLIPIPLYLATKVPQFDRRRIMLACIGAVIVLSIAYRAYRVGDVGPMSYHEWNYTLRMQVASRMDSLMFGLLGAYLSLYHQAFWRKIASFALVTGLALLVFDRAMHLKGEVIYRDHFSLVIAPMATLLLLPRLSNWRAESGPIVGVVTFISVVSYSMYLLNQAPILETLMPLLMPKLMHFLWRFAEHTRLVAFLLYWVLVFAGSYALYRWYERPMTNLRERWSRRGHAPAQAFHRSEAH